MREEGRLRLRALSITILSAFACYLAVLGLLLGARSMLNITIPEDRAVAEALGLSQDQVKFASLSMQKTLASRDDVYMIRGSSELSSTFIPSHPANVFAGQRVGFAIDLEGRGHWQSLAHAIALGALDDSISGRKFAFIVSSQWFEGPGVEPGAFASLFSPVQLEAFLRSPNLDKGLKDEMAKRVLELLRDGKEGYSQRTISRFQGAGPLQVDVALLAPLDLLKSLTLDISDRWRSHGLFRRVVSAGHSGAAVDPGTSGPIDWTALEKTSMEDAKAKVTNNRFAVYDSYFDTYLRAHLDEWEGSRNRSLRYAGSREYGDFDLLLRVCAALHCKPFIVLAPVNGRWYDFTGADREMRENHYAKVRTMIQEAGFKCLDLTTEDYEPYVLCDIMHMGWKGWIQIDRGILESR